MRCPRRSKFAPPAEPGVRRRDLGSKFLGPQRPQRHQRNQTDRENSEPLRRPARRAGPQNSACVAPKWRNGNNRISTSVRNAGGRAGGADQKGLGFVGDALDDRAHFLAVLLAPDAEEGLPAQFAHEEGVGPAAAIRRGKPARDSKSRMKVSASTPRMEPGSTSLRSGALRAPFIRRQYSKSS